MLRERPCRLSFEKFKGRRRTLLFLVALTAFFSLASVADPNRQPWADKDWTKWSSWDCEYTLKYSPWTCLKDLGGCETGSSTFRQSDYWSLIRFESALPVRQGHLRNIQLEKHYDRMNPEERKAFDEEHVRELKEGDGGRVILMWSNEAPLMGDREKPYDSSFPSRQAALVLSDGRLVMPIQTKVSGYVVGSTAEYVFPRMIDGRPLYTQDDKLISIVFGDVLPYNGHGKDEILGPQKEGDFHRYLDSGYNFQISKLMYRGKLEY
jgi:hypothetical protein